MMAETTPDRARLRALCEQATKGPWSNGRPKTETAGCVFSTCEADGLAEAVLLRCWFTPDAEFIAAARNALPSLLDQLDQQAETIQRMTKVLDCAVDDNHLTYCAYCGFTLASLRQRLAPQEWT